MGMQRERGWNEKGEGDDLLKMDDDCDDLTVSRTRVHYLKALCKSPTLSGQLKIGEGFEQQKRLRSVTRADVVWIMLLFSLNTPMPIVAG